MKEKKANGVQLLLRAVVKDPDGKILSDTGQKPAKSFLIQFLEFFRCLFDGINEAATDVFGAEEYIYNQGGSYQADKVFLANAPINDSDAGIVVGIGDTAETNTDHKLETQLTEGIGAGNITHGEVVIETTAVVGANVDLEAKRSFPNNTGETITVKEAGIYSRIIRPTAPNKFHCIIRDVLDAPGIDVPDMCSLTVYYTFRTTV